MTTEKERLVASLFSDRERELIDFKLCRGTNATITEEEVCAEVNRSLAEVSTGVAVAGDQFDRNKLQKTSFAHLL
jgi:hypothetical protein